jgi:SpoVK/Ycf46/Vps4 family AAA+-type ATPase
MHINPDKNELFMLKKCLEYLQNHLNRYRHFNRETLTFLCWAVGPEITRIGEVLIGEIQSKHREKFEAELSESENDLDDWEEIITRMFRKIPPRSSKKAHRQILKLIWSLYSKIKYRGKSEIEKNMAALKKMFDLTNREVDFCVFLLILYSFEEADKFFVDHLECNKMIRQRYLANLLNFSKKELNDVLNGTLKKISLFEMDNFFLRLEDDFIQLFQNTADQSFSKNFYSRVPTNKIPFDYYFIKKEKRNHILNLLKEKPETSTHILFYGPPGTGKTSFAYSLANHFNIPVYEIVRGEDNTTKNRRAGIVACQNITNVGNGSLVLVDEADNLLNTEASWFMRGETQDKGWLNELLEKPGIRMIWITNSIYGIEGSVLRRFAYSLHFRPFNRRQRIQLWDNILQKNKCKKLFSSKEIEKFAKKYPVNAGIIDLAVKKSLESNLGSKADFHRSVDLALTAHETLLNNGETKVNKDRVEKHYSLEGLNVKGDLKATLKQLKAFDEYLRKEDRDKSMNMNLLFYGPPGTGKSELARYIAEKLDREIICKRISDIQDKYVGETEKNIKNAFLVAEREEAILVIDEADSLLFSRDRAVRSWEISFTNEFLTQMERYHGILICTTNRMKDLDQASIRRFNHKIGFDYLTDKGNQIFYDLFLAPIANNSLNTATRTKIQQINHLTPGDFKVIRDRYSFYPSENVDHSMMVEALQEEAEIKVQQHDLGKKIGF